MIMITANETASRNGLVHRELPKKGTEYLPQPHLGPWATHIHTPTHTRAHAHKRTHTHSGEHTHTESIASGKSKLGSASLPKISVAVACFTSGFWSQWRKRKSSAKSGACTLLAHVFSTFMRFDEWVCVYAEPVLHDVHSWLNTACHNCPHGQTE